MLPNTRTAVTSDKQNCGMHHITGQELAASTHVSPVPVVALVVSRTLSSTDKRLSKAFSRASLAYQVRRSDRYEQ